MSEAPRRAITFRKDSRCADCTGIARVAELLTDQITTIHESTARIRADELNPDVASNALLVAERHEREQDIIYGASMTDAQRAISFDCETRKHGCFFSSMIGAAAVAEAQASPITEA
jgi:hypothetical protein